MARARMISASLSSSRKFAALHEVAPKLAEFAQSLYPLIVVHADDFGRMSGDAWSVKFQAHPASPRSVGDFDAALDALNEVGLIERYASEEGDKCLSITQFDGHQAGLHKRTRSKFPEPPGNSRKFPEIPSDKKGTEQIGKEKKHVPGADAPGFDVFWNAYPRKDAKKDALKAWNALRPDDAIQARMGAAIRAQSATEQWRKGRTFIPLPASWLRGERWNDEAAATPIPLTPAEEPWMVRCKHEPQCPSADWHTIQCERDAEAFLIRTGQAGVA